VGNLIDLPVRMREGEFTMSPTTAAGEQLL
jgi:hypothetical protein